MTFSPDGGRLLTVDQNRQPSAPRGLVQCWDTATGAQLSRFVVPPAPPGSAPAAYPDVASVSPDLRWVVVPVPGHCAVYDITSGRLFKALPAPTGRYTVAFSPDARRLAVGDESGIGGVLLWDTTTWQPVRVLDKHGAGVTGIHFSRDGTRLALGSKAGLAWWDTRTWKPGGRFAAPSAYGLHKFYFTPDGHSLLINQPADSPDAMQQVDCGTGRKTLTASGQILLRASLEGDRAETVILPRSYQFLLFRETYCIWDTDRKQVLYRITVPSDTNSFVTSDFQTHAADLSADGHVFAAGGRTDGTIRVWRLP